MYLHSLDPPIFHGDIKPQNVIVQDDLKAALCDFGISKLILASGEHSGFTTADSCSGTSGYEPKEILNEGPPTTAADVYSFGGLILAVRLISYLPLGELSIILLSFSRLDNEREAALLEEEMYSKGCSYYSRPDSESQRPSSAV